MEEEKKIAINQPIIDDFVIIRDLGKGGNATVKLGQHRLTGQYNAIKFCNNSTNMRKNQETMENEATILSKLKHQNIINLIEFKVQNDKIYSVLELAEEGELYDYVEKTGPFSEEFAHALFYQFIDGLSYCHSKQIAHRDIKLENILLDRNFCLKISDFGFSVPFGDKKHLNTSIMGTQGYIAPEIFQYQSKSPECADIFAAGVMLFILHSGTYPFRDATTKDLHFQLIIKKQLNRFWRVHSQHQPADYFSLEFQDLINKMLCYQPSQRITLEQIKQHPWFTQAILSKDEIRNEFERRKQTLSQ